MHAPLGIDTQASGQTLEADVARGAALAQRLRQAQCIEAEREQPAALRAAAGPRLAGGVAHGVRQLPAQHPRHVGEHQTVEFLVGAHVRLEGIGGRVGGYVTGVMKAQLRPQQAFGVGLCRGEDELDVAATPRLELQPGTECGLQAPVARRAVADAQHLGDRAGVVGA